VSIALAGLMYFISLVKYCSCMLVLLALAACGQNEPAEALTAAPDRPNFVIIMTDDMGFTDFGAFGGRDMKTPNLDNLALNGIRFTNFHGHLSCAPSRAMLMSGMGNHEAGLGTQRDIERFRGERNYERYLVDRVATLPEILADAGYRTYLAGKWGLGGPQALDPTQRGFGKAFALVPSGGGHLQALFHESRYTFNGKPVTEPEDPIYSTTLFTDQLIAFFEEDRGSDQPFFALFAPTAPHWPLHMPPGMKVSDEASYDGGYDKLRSLRLAGAALAGVLPEGVNSNPYPSKAIPWDSLDTEEKALQIKVMEIYAAMIGHLDQEVGRLLNYLQDMGALENTLILVINDNGAQGGPVFGGPPSYLKDRSFDNRPENLGRGSSWANMGQGWADAVNAPFRDGKGTVYEGGVRVAAFANWSKIERPAAVYRQYLNNMDVLPSLLELAGIDHPAPHFNDRDILPVRGKSFAGVLRGDNSSVHADDEAITLSGAGKHFMQRGKWKLLKELDADWELYDLATDPYESQNLAAARPTVLQEMLVEFRLDAERNNILDR
jgi:arylsulfatase A-like enzyme